MTRDECWMTFSEALELYLQSRETARCWPPGRKREVRADGFVCVGDRVRHAVQNYDRIGTVLEIEDGVNGCLRIRFDGREFDSLLPAKDVCREDWLRGNGK